MNSSAKTVMKISATLNIGKLGAKSNRVVIGVILCGFILSFFVPSTTARVACLVPIVMGMIKAFSSLGGGGGVDSAALSVGISEALVNTAFGILTGALAVIAYNYFSAKIDNISYAIDEIGFAITGVFQSRH